MNKEEIYDKDISPLMTKIISICKKNNIAMIASFRIPTDDDPDLACTTMLPDEDGNPQEHEYALDALKGRSVAPLKITTYDKDGRISGQSVVIP
jgi:hypothetical protein